LSGAGDVSYSAPLAIYAYYRTNENNVILINISHFFYTRFYLPKRAITRQKTGGR
jgi:hypothetical protein